MTKKSVAIIIVNYNTHDHLKDCLDSIESCLNSDQIEVIVVDNNSTNREIETFEAIYRQVRFVFRTKNDGFGAGCNAGASLTNCEYLLFLNPDIILKSNVVNEMIDFLNCHSDVVACSCLFEDANGKLIYSYNYYPNLYSDMKEVSWIGFNNHIRDLLSRKEIKNMIPFRIDYSLGAFIFVRRKIFNLINGFDERFFLYGEDIDLGIRLNEHGKIYCLPGLRVFHFYRSSISSRKGKQIESLYLSRSKLILMYKHYSFLHRTAGRIIQICGYMFRIFLVPVNPRHKGDWMYAYRRLFSAMFETFRIFDLCKFRKAVDFEHATE